MLQNHLHKIYCPGGMTLDDSSVIAELNVRKGDIISRNQILIVLHSGDFYLELNGEIDGKVDSVFISEGQKVNRNQILLEIRPWNAIS